MSPADGGGPLVILAPHPDDEVLGAGALLAGAARRGRSAQIVLLTDGAASHAGVPDLAARRLAEARAGLAALDLPAAALWSLGEPDGALDAARVDLAPLLKRVPPDATLVVTDPSDAHPDHRAAFGIATRLCAPARATALWTMPVSQRLDECFVATPRWQALEVGPHHAAKVAAMAAHHSQTGEEGYRVPPAGMAATFEREYFARVWARGADSSVAPAHFDALFAASPDPWGYAREAYEADRFARTLAAIGPAPGRLFEAGAAAGHLTERLAAVATHVVALEASAAALAHARVRLEGQANVTLVEGRLPDALPDGPFDTILLSDMLYYLGLDGVAALAADLLRQPPPRRIVATNYLGETDAALTGDMAAEALIAHLLGWRVTARERCDRLRIDVLEPRG